MTLATNQARFTWSVAGLVSRPIGRNEHGCIIQPIAALRRLPSILVSTHDIVLSAYRGLAFEATDLDVILPGIPQGPFDNAAQCVLARLGHAHSGVDVVLASGEGWPVGLARGT
jgi:hypothetical protein